MNALQRIRSGAAAIGFIALAAGALWAAFAFMRQPSANRVLVVIVAIVAGVAGVFFLFWSMDQAVNRLPARWREHVRPWVFVGPAVLFLGLFLAYPVINTLATSFRDAHSQG